MTVVGSRRLRAASASPIWRLQRFADLAAAQRRVSMVVKKRGNLAQRFFQARKMLSRRTEATLRSRVKGRLRPYAAWRSAPFTRRRGDMLGRGSKCGSIALTAMQTGHFCRQLYAVFHRQQHRALRLAKDVENHALSFT